jgi:hypothetical protein
MTPSRAAPRAAAEAAVEAAVEVQTDVADTTSSPAAPVAAEEPAEQAPRLADLAFTIVPHTHWDREWYLPFEVFRLRLLGTVDGILDTLDADPSFRCFTLDGQAAILDDYLELRPEREPQLRRLIATRRLAVGPGYVLPDEFLVGAETHVRNLLAGTRRVRDLGGEPMAIGYAPDAFGHIAAMPTILAGFALPGFVFWRGMGDEADELPPLFRWVGPDGSVVVAVRQLDGYGGGHDLGRWSDSGVSVHLEPALHAEAAARRFVRFLTRHGPTIARSSIRHLTLASGADHVPIQPDLPAMVAAAATDHPATRFEIGRYDDYLASFSEDELGALPAHAGELVGAREAHVVRGVNSTRVYLKQRHEAAERALLAAETVSSLASLARGVAYPAAALRHAWRELLRNSPHDSIPGCSIDAVHVEMLVRYARVEQIAGRLVADGAAAYVGRTEPWAAEPPMRSEIAIHNLLPAARTLAVEIDLPPHAGVARDTLVAECPEGALPVQVVGESGARGLVLSEVPGWSARSFVVRRGVAAEPPAAAIATGHRSIGNEHLAVEAAEDGSLRVTDLATGRRYEGIAAFADDGEAGDEYTHEPVVDAGWTSRGGRAAIRVTESGPLRATLEVSLVARVPAGLRDEDQPGAGRSDHLVDVPITVSASLLRGGRQLWVRVVVDNRARDHRVRMLVPSDGHGVRAEGQFAVVRRDGPRPMGRDWQEAPSATAHTTGFIAAGSVSVFTHGTPEYEAIEAPEGDVLAVTLIRAVGRLSRDLPARAGSGAGPATAVPDAQCLETHVFAFELGFGDVDDAALAATSASLRTPAVVGPAGLVPPVPMRIGGGPVVATALKAAEDGDGFVVRLWNPSDAPVAIELDRLAVRCRLDEEPVDGGLEIGPRAIATFRFGARVPGWAGGPGSDGARPAP